MAELPALLVSGDLFASATNLNGRRWVSQQLLRLWAAACGSDPLHLLTASAADLETLRPQLQQAGHSGALIHLPIHQPAACQAAGSVLIADPSIASWARWRQAAGPASFSLIGQIHTLSTTGAIAHLEALAHQPLHPWDALVCSSSAGRAVVEALLEEREAFLAERYGGSRKRARRQRPQLPVIPLPVPVGDLIAALPDRQQARAALGLPADAHVLVWLGRLSMLTKADPWPTYALLQQLAGELDRPLILIEVGPNDTPEQGAHFEQLRQLAPDVGFLRLGGAAAVPESQKRQALAAADVAISLVDNIQETFGLAVVEAMAAGLPVLASDWDGYRDLIQQGEQGWLVPSRWSSCASAASFPLGWSQAAGWHEHPFCAGALAQLVQLDLHSALSQLRLLLSQPERARAMGERGRQRALSHCDAPVVMEHYAALHRRLAKQRAKAKQRQHEPSTAPLGLDPVRLFGHYPSHAPAQNPDQPLTLSQLSAIPEAVRQGRRGLWQPLTEWLPEAQQLQLRQALQAKHAPPQDVSHSTKRSQDPWLPR